MRNLPQPTIACRALGFFAGVAFAFSALWNPVLADGPSNGGIVSIGGTTTEIIYALGLADKIKAVDTTSLYPPEARKKPNIGYMRTLAVEPILAMAPSLVIADSRSGPATVLKQLTQAGISVVKVPAEPTVEGVYERIGIIAKTLKRKRQGDDLIAKLRRQIDAVSKEVAKKTTKPKVLFLLSIGQGGAPLSGGANTSSDGIINLAGGINAAQGFRGYKPISPEAIIEAKPDVLLITQRSLKRFGGKEALFKVPAVIATPAGKARRVVTMDGLLLLGFGPRIGIAIKQLADGIHAEPSQKATAQ
ncbi:MAG: hemin ABC transporter substrate-binding protein [Rhodospirillaceae bacterium]|nr:hemin ABC transporter substrate-binding protein [Rhodospirillaceae bacterium]